MTCEAASGLACFRVGKVAKGEGSELIFAHDVEGFHARLIDKNKKKGGERVTLVHSGEILKERGLVSLFYVQLKGLVHPCNDIDQAGREAVLFEY